MQNLFRSMEPNGEMIHYDLALASLIKMGYSDYETLAAVTPLLPRFYDERATDEENPHHPTQRADRTMGFLDWLPSLHWKRSWKIFCATISSRTAVSKNLSRQTTAALLWQELDRRRVIKIKGDQENGFWPQRKQTRINFVAT